MAQDGEPWRPTPCAARVARQTWCYDHAEVELDGDRTNVVLDLVLEVEGTPR